jgi:hypothetical protein
MSKITPRAGGAAEVILWNATVEGTRNPINQSINHKKGDLCNKKNFEENASCSLPFPPVKIKIDFKKGSESSKGGRGCRKQSRKLC